MMRCEVAEPDQLDGGVLPRENVEIDLGVVVGRMWLIGLVGWLYNSRSMCLVVNKETG